MMEPCNKLQRLDRIEQDIQGLQVTDKSMRKMFPA